MPQRVLQAAMERSQRTWQKSVISGRHGTQQHGVQGVQGAHDSAAGAQAGAVQAGSAGAQAGAAQAGSAGAQAGAHGVQHVFFTMNFLPQGTQTGLQTGLQGHGTQTGLQMGLQHGVHGTQAGLHGSQAGLHGSQAGLHGSQAGLQQTGLQQRRPLKRSHLRTTQHGVHGVLHPQVASWAGAHSCANNGAATKEAPISKSAERIDLAFIVFSLKGDFIFLRFCPETKG